MNIQEVRAKTNSWVLEPPSLEDGPALTALIKRCPPLDENSAYCNLLQLSHFADTAIVTRDARETLLGAVTGYALPEAPHILFIWQVAVAPEARGEGLALTMLQSLVRRPRVRPFKALMATVTADNAASWALFNRFAEAHGAALRSGPWLDEHAHFDGAHASEHRLLIEPLTS
jgi:L-2,4-diaminobutyric acid acetyltransferase